METNWQALRPRLIAALVNVFDEQGLRDLLQDNFGRRLDDLVARDVKFPRKVREVVDEAERAGWLEDLVAGAVGKRPAHTVLQPCVTEFQAGVAAQGKTYYQASAVAQEAGIEENAVLRRRIYPYLETLQRRTYSVPLTGLDQSGEQGQELALSQVFVALNMEDRRVDWQQKGDNRGILKDAVGHLHAERRLILLGDPGSGKSTLLRYVAHCLAGAVRRPDDDTWREQLGWPVMGGSDRSKNIKTQIWTGDAPIPAIVVLRDFARRDFDRDDGTAIVDFLCRQLEADDLGECDEPLRELARRGQVLFLLDGVDEVPADERPAIWAAIQAMDRGVYGGNRWVATCRVLSFDPNEAPAAVPVRRLQPLDDDQIQRFIDNWYAGLLESGQVTRELAAVKAGALKAAVQRLALRELAGNPMLLTIMALVQTFRGTLPDDRAKLYQACVETLLLRWQLRLEQGSDGDIPDALRALGTTRENLERLLWEIAWEAHSKAEDRQKSADIPRWDVIRIAESHLGSLARAEQFLDYTERRAHLLVARGGRQEQVYSFPHRTFQEYLAACHLASQRRFELRARDLAAESDDWREVLNLAVGALAFNQNNREKAFDAVARVMLENLSVAKDTAAWRRVWLAGEMCATIGREEAERDEIGREILPQLRQQLVALLANEALTPAQRAEAGDALGRLGDPRPGVCTLEPDLIPIEAGEFIFGSGEKRIIRQPFAMARYPVTVAQFNMFVTAAGYEEPRYWGGEDSPGWRWREKDHPDYRGEGPVTQPRFWQQPVWHVDNRPVVGVSWYEAAAYCAWLTERTGREYRLPAEEEWERAARHTDGREWAWGNEWRDGIINSREAGIGRTTAVGCFPRGAAECGAEDMSGNVWEWTSSNYSIGGSSYVVRGGSWYNTQYLARVAYRNHYNPRYSDHYPGFRVVSPVVF